MNILGYKADDQNILNTTFHLEHYLHVRSTNTFIVILNGEYANEVYLSESKAKTNTTKKLWDRKSMCNTKRSHLQLLCAKIRMQVSVRPIRSVYITYGLEMTACNSIGCGNSHKRKSNRYLSYRDPGGNVP